MSKPPILLIHAPSGEAVRYVRGVPVLFELVSDWTKEHERQERTRHCYELAARRGWVWATHYRIALTGDARAFGYVGAIY